LSCKNKLTPKAMDLSTKWFNKRSLSTKFPKNSSKQSPSKNSSSNCRKSTKKY